MQGLLFTAKDGTIFINDSLGGIPMEGVNKIPQRDEIAMEDKWATEDLYPSDEAWEAELATIAEDQKNAVACAGKLGESAANLYHYISDGEKVGTKISLLGNYCMRKADEDTRNPKYQGMVGRF